MTRRSRAPAPAPSAALVLNRFLPGPGARALDLSSGHDVWMCRRAVDSRESVRLARIAGRVAGLGHPALVRLLDFGGDDETWVEFWDVRGVPERWCGGAQVRDRVTRRAARALRAVGCRLAVKASHDLVSVGGQPAFVPTPGAACEEAPDDSTAGGAGSAGEAGFAVVWRAPAELAGILDAMEGMGPSGPRALHVAAAPGCGMTTLFSMVARAAGQRGWVPVAGRLIGGPDGDAAALGSLTAVLRGRHVVVLQDLRRYDPAGRSCWGEALARFLGTLDAACGRAHMVILGTSEAREPGLALAPWPAERLSRVVRNLDVPSSLWSQRCEEALRRSGGWPGRFVRALQAGPGSDPASAYPRQSSDPILVRERAIDIAACAGGPTEASLGRAREQVRSGLALIGRGRRAAGERVIQRALGAMARRGAQLDAGWAGLVLARVLWRRGLSERAAAALGRAHESFIRAQDSSGMLAGLVMQGWVAMDDDRLAEAESLFLTARAAGEHASSDLGRAAACVSLAQCHRWQERWTDVARDLDGFPSPADPGSRDPACVADGPEAGLPAPGFAAGGGVAALPVGCPFVVATALRALAACSHGNIGRAARELHAFTAGGVNGRSASLGWFVDAIALRVHAALGDREAVERIRTSGLQSARRAREPLGMLEIRVSHAEALLDLGDTPAFRAALGGLERWRRAAIPALLRRRIEQLTQRLRSAAIRAPAEASSPFAHADALRVLECCRDGTDDGEVVRRMCERVRMVLDASAVIAYGAAERAPEVVGRSGSAAPPIGGGLLERVLDGALTLGPERTLLGIEAAAPVRYGGLTIGAVVVRWTALGRPDAASAVAVLHAAATALGPALRAHLESRADASIAGAAHDDILGRSKAIEMIRDQIRRAASAPFPVLVQGESGTGKELVSRSLHRSSARRTRRFCALNCAAVGDDLFEAELFGHARGAFTGAVAERAGLFEEADGGTLLLDEIGELSPRGQAKLLRAIQEGEIRRIGESFDRRVDVRVIAATNRALDEDVRAGRFRQDLLFRLDVVRITIPPLRDRPEDVADLTARFWGQAAERIGSHAVLAPATVARLLRYPWPGNARELQNVLSAVAVRAPRRGPIGPSWLPGHVGEWQAPDVGCGGTLAEARRKFDEHYVRRELARHRGQRARTASALGLTRQGLAKLLDRLGIDATC